MNELEKELLNLVRDGRDTVVSQAPDVIRQTLQYDIVSTYGWLIIFGVIAVICPLLIYAWVKENRKPYQDRSEMLFGCLLLGVIGSILSFLAIVCNLATVYQIKNYPKGYLLDKFEHHSCK